MVLADADTDAANDYTRWLTAQIGELITHLKRNGLFEKTLIVFCSDHGEQLGDHWLYRKSTALEGSAGVPLIIKPPADWQC